ncbi:PepSY domain-containing protein [Alteromonas lipolytica]|uniref:PepSY domain-containing protein n=1 Tax=Alteromonas lipolytica TaxID=1856405 RepID=A0A1E8FEH1_9ALTE|nr:PepSY domain-containing protein [Alteromonas lipolytica]OFI34347.1 hypothetical protein BFC17_18345 [Alteromonas lipolytica]
MFKSIVTGVVLIMLALTSIEVQAQQDKQQPVKNSSQAVQQAKRHTEGRVLKVDRKPSSYRVKVLKKSGRVVTLDVDKRSGKVQPSKRKDGN